MKTPDSLDTVRDLCQQREQSVLAGYSQALLAVEETSQLVQSARTRLEEAQTELRRASLPAIALRRLQEEIELLRDQRRDAEEQATAARRESEQALVSVLSARRTCAVVDNYCASHDSDQPPSAPPLSAGSFPR